MLWPVWQACCCRVAGTGEGGPGTGDKLGQAAVSLRPRPGAHIEVLEDVGHLGRMEGAGIVTLDDVGRRGDGRHPVEPVVPYRSRAVAALQPGGRAAGPYERPVAL